MQYISQNNSRRCHVDKEIVLRPLLQSSIKATAGRKLKITIKQYNNPKIEPAYYTFPCWTREKKLTLLKNKLTCTEIQVTSSCLTGFW